MARMNLDTILDRFRGTGVPVAVLQRYDVELPLTCGKLGVTVMADSPDEAKRIAIKRYSHDWAVIPDLSQTTATLFNPDGLF